MPLCQREAVLPRKMVSFRTWENKTSGECGYLCVFPGCCCHSQNDVTPLVGANTLKGSGSASKTALGEGSAQAQPNGCSACRTHGHWGPWKPMQLH